MTAVVDRGFLCSLVVIAACREPDEPVPLYDGEWIDIAGVGREPTDACEGTFNYVDAYAGVLAAEFGLDVPLGNYIWYTPEDYDDLLPCSEVYPYPYSCAQDDLIHSAFMPLEHEIVHVANFHTGVCPNALGEGLAVYYSIEEQGADLDIEVLAGHLAAPSESMPQRDYEMLGRLASFLIERYGLAAIRDVCATAGPEATGPELAQVMESILGASPDDILSMLSEQPTSCNDFRRYRSKVFACGVAAAAPNLGTVVDDHLEASLAFGCDQRDTVGTVDDDEIWRMWSVEIPVDEHWWFSLRDEALDQPPVATTLEVSRCGPCEDFHRFEPIEYQFPALAVLEAGRHVLEVRVPAEFEGTLQLTIDNY